MLDILKLKLTAKHAQITVNALNSHLVALQNEMQETINLRDQIIAAAEKEQERKKSK